MHIPSFFDQMNIEYNSMTPMNMTPAAAPGGPPREPTGVEEVSRANYFTPATLQGATMRCHGFRVRPCQDNHFNQTFRVGKFKGARNPLMNQYGNFHNQIDGLLDQPWIVQTNPILEQADMFMPQYNVPIPMPA